MQVFTDPGRDLEDPQEDEEGAQEDGQTFQHDLGHCSPAGFGTCNKIEVLDGFFDRKLAIKPK